MSLPEPHPKMDVVLDILGVCVLTDRLQRDEELVEFCSCAQRLSRVVDADLVYSRRDLLEWFDANKHRLMGIVDDKAKTLVMLNKVTDGELQRQVLIAIFAICVCDYNLADEESHYIQMALGAWHPTTLTSDCVSVLA